MTEAMQADAGPRTVWTKAGPVRSARAPAELQAMGDTARATCADAAPLGYYGFATGTWIMSLVGFGVFSPSHFADAAPVLLVFAGVAQFIAGLLLFRRLQTLMATEFCIFGALNVISSFIFLSVAGGWAPGARHGDATVFLGLVMEAFGGIALVLVIGTIRLTWAGTGVAATRAAGYILSGLPFLTTHLGIGAWGQAGHAGACFLFAAALASYYAGTAHLVNSTWRRSVLPTGGFPG